MAGFYGSAGRIYIENTSGDVVFDTDEGLFVVTDRVTDSITLPSRTGTITYSGGSYTNNPSNVDTSHSITSVNSAADTVRGVFEVSVPGTGGIAGWLPGVGAYNAGGTYMHYTGGNNDPSDAGNSATDKYWGASILAYTFIASGGSLVLHERTVIQAQPTFAPASTSTTFRAPTFDFDLFVGTFV